MAGKLDLKVKIESDAKVALKARNTEKLGVLRLILAAIKQVEIDEQKDLTEIELINILQSMVKQRKDSIAQFQKADRLELVKIEEFEIEVLNSYLPEMLPEDQIRVFVDNVKRQLNAESIRDMGQVMAELKTQLAGRADMAKVSAIVKEQLSK